MAKASRAARLSCLRAMAKATSPMSIHHYRQATIVSLRRRRMVDGKLRVSFGKSSAWGFVTKATLTLVAFLIEISRTTFVF